MSGPLLGCIADDYTGATDLSSMLVRAGLRVIQCFGTPDANAKYGDADAVVVSLKSRSIPADEAVSMSFDALRFLRSIETQRYFFKYCSTFDSTPAGNIGPVADALADELDASQVIFCPAFPENGRTVYCGHLFVGGVPLHESSMRNHPLNPMTDSDLVRVLQAQSKRKVERLSLGNPQRDESGCHLIADSINEDDLKRVAEFSREHRLLTGGSAIARYWAEALLPNQSRRSIEAETNEDCADNLGSDAAEQSTAKAANSQTRSVVLAGSCSDATRNQISEFAATFPVMNVDLSLTSIDDSASLALDWCDQQWHQSDESEKLILISSGANTEVVEAARRRWGDQEAANRVEQIFALIAKGLVERGVGRIVVAGGETSGAVINSLGIDAVRIGREIAPGVPWVEAIGLSQGGHPLSLALKSGNFGGPRFFFDALECEP
ncbi:hypothetical protein Pla22_43550 [Rubripirellula amarantea]|uniref:3-oxo-tetronate kinase n=1 Tax=Rubripirellula amarantea TaxID=2527999 RepID=A0A5C5WGM2_9BACT|nr:3-oxo-tetronate kinase [Rubripirellula amarantea]TWT49163.1 hypothetical protein Pla22_43550 [Rubripirellula amarantea]